MTFQTQQRFKFGTRPSALRQAGMDRVGIGHALVDNCTFQEACKAIIEHARDRGEPAYATTANAQHVVLLDQDLRLRQIYDAADLVVPDGASLLLAARLYGHSLRERVAGVDMFQMLCEMAAENRLHVFLLGGRAGSADLTATTLKQRFPALRISTYCPPLGFEKTEAGLEMAAAAVREASPHLLFVALGAPKQEYWIYEHGTKLSVPMCMGVGGSFEMVAGIVPRAPVWIQKLDCEWLYRLCREPRRMWRRYLIGNLEFAAIVARQRFRRAFLNAFIYLVDKDSFAAEIHEPSMKSKRQVLMNVMNFASEEIIDPRPSDALAG